MKLHPDWKGLAKRSWSLRIIYLSLGLDGAEFIVDALTGNAPIPLPWFLAIGFGIKVSAGLARVLAQPCFAGGRNEQA